MGWMLELVQTGPSGEQGRLRVADLGEIDAPSHVDEVGLGLTTAHRLLQGQRMRSGGLNLAV